MLTISTWRSASLRVIPVFAFLFTSSNAYARDPAENDPASNYARFQYGFQKLVAGMDPDTVAAIGPPLENEHSIGGGYQIQYTANGMMVWKPGIAPQFFDGYHRYALDDAGALVKWDGPGDDDEVMPAEQPTLTAASTSTTTVAARAPAGVPYGVWDRLAACESGGNWASSSNPRYKGGLQEDATFWANYGGLAYARAPNLASREAQILVAQRGQAAQGWGAWPVCSRVVGLR